MSAIAAFAQQVYLEMAVEALRGLPAGCGGARVRFDRGKDPSGAFMACFALGSKPAAEVLGPAADGAEWDVALRRPLVACLRYADGRFAPACPVFEDRYDEVADGMFGDLAVR